MDDSFDDALKEFYYRGPTKNRSECISFDLHRHVEEHVEDHVSMQVRKQVWEQVWDQVRDVEMRVRWQVTATQKKLRKEARNGQ